ncbi:MULTISPECIES: hypothetical protein [unclassified Burkholderia]|uniref:hypothetical protein n=1 Tax=unclassified Burkholderia TaxID=2613784 RepID=UPI000F57FE07|nr:MULTISPECIES: hypothetical protein [unclassified Burkholderia]
MKILVPNPSNYTAENYSQDVMAMLPFALKEYQKNGSMVQCAHCGAAHSSTNFQIHKCTEQAVITDIEIVSVCDKCASKPTLPSPGQWAHVGKTSGLFVPEDGWATFAMGLRWLGAYALRETVGWPLISRLLHADGSLCHVANAVAFSGTRNNGTWVIPLVFSWPSDEVVFAAGEAIKSSLDEVLFGAICLPGRVLH